MSPRPYRMAQRQIAADETRQRILVAARTLLLSNKFSEFTMEAVGRAADVSRLTVYYQFNSKAGLLEVLYDYLAHRGRVERMGDIFRQGGDPARMLDHIIQLFANFWASDREVIRRLHAMGAIDEEIGAGLRARNERRRKALSVIFKRYAETHPHVTSRQISIAIDTLHMLTSFETFDALLQEGRTFEDVVGIIHSLAHHAIGDRSRSAELKWNR